MIPKRISGFLLRLCARLGYLDGCVALLSRGANPHEENEDGENAFHRAIAGKHPGIVRVLIERSSELVSNEVANQEAPLCWAYAVACVPGRRTEAQDEHHRRSLDSLRTLLEAGALEKECENVLSAAVTAGDVIVAELLMRFGAAPERRNTGDRSAFEIASASDDSKMVNILTRKSLPTKRAGNIDGRSLG